MLFNSYGFVFLFFPFILIGLSIIRRVGGRTRGGRDSTRLEKVFLFVVSLVFYGWVHPEYLPFLLGSMAVNYFISWQMERTGQKKWVLVAGLIVNISALACFKYIGIGGFVPLGVSFFTFSQVAFLMECYGGNLKGTGPLTYGLYVSFFPKIMQGPIALPGEMLPQFERVNRQVDWERIYRNLNLFVLGLFKKVLIADTLGKAVDFGYSNLALLNSGDGMIVMLSYTLQLYFDFSGYCDMAMGIAGILGTTLPINFDSPYKAVNILDFWKRWHITLTGFFTKYLYISLGGNRKGKCRTYLNCLLVFFVSGIWHGAGWQFIVWGLMHGVLYVITRAWKDWGECHGKSASTCDLQQGANGNPNTRDRFLRRVCARDHMTTCIGVRWWKRIWHGICVCLTFLYVNVAWIFFRAPSVKEAVSLIKKIGAFRFGRINWDLAGCFQLDEFWYVIKVLRLDHWQYAHYILMVLALIAVLLLVFFGESARCFVKKVRPNVANTIFMAVLFVWSVLSFSGVSSFLYVNF